MEEAMTYNRAVIVFAAFLLVLGPSSTSPVTAQSRFDRSGPRPPPAEKYRISDSDLRDIGIAHGAMPALPNKCYENVSISNEFLQRFTTKGFSLEALCLAITSPWVQYHPETGRPLAVSKDFLLVVPDCFKNGAPFLDCKFNYDHTSGLKFVDAGQDVHARAMAVDAAVRRVIASGRYGTQCGCENMRWTRDQLELASRPYCRVDVAPACLEQMSRQKYRIGSLVAETNGYSFENVLTKGATDYGDFDISPRLMRGYAYRIGSPEGDDDTPYVALPPGRRIGIGVQ
jgi:hypothetical protein